VYDQQPPIGDHEPALCEDIKVAHVGVDADPYPLIRIRRRIDARRDHVGSDLAEG
jgi:hypothetical protein